MKPKDDAEFIETSEDSFEELLSNYKPIKSPWKELPFPDLNNTETIAEIERNPYLQIRTVKKFTKDLLVKGNLKEAFSLARKPISEIESLLKRNKNPQLISFLVFLHENIGWLVNQLPKDKKLPYIDIGINSIETAHNLGKSAYGVVLYNRIHILTQWVNLLTAQGRKEVISDCLKEIENIEKEFSKLPGIRGRLGFNEIKKTIDFKIALNKFYYKISRKTKYSTYSLKAKKILISALEDWLKFLNPRWKSKDINLEYDLKPTKNWTKFEQENVEREINKKRKIERTVSPDRDRFNDETVQHIKSIIVELLFAAAKAYLKLGHHSHAHRLLRIVNIYGVGKNGTLEQRLDFVKDMADIEENENLLKAIDRLELILPEIEDGSNHQQLKRLPGYIHKLEQLYSRIGLQDIAISLCKRFNIEQTVKFQKDKKEVETEVGLDKLIGSIKENIKNERPTPIIHSIENLDKYLMSLGYEDAINENLEQIKALRADVNSFIKKWIQFTELREIQHLKYGSCIDSGLVPDDTKSYAEVFLNLAVILCEMFNHALLPQFLYHLAKSQRELEKPLWIKNMVYSCLIGAQFGDPVNFFKSFKAIKGLLSQSRVSSDDIITEYLRAKLFKDTIVFCERIIERIVFAKERSDFIEKISPYVDIATFGLSDLNIIEDKASWIFRGVNLLKARALTGLRLEIPSELKKQDWLRLKELQLLESELITLKENNTEVDNKVDKEKILQEKYELFIKINCLGIGGCPPEGIKKVLDSYKDKKICVVSFLLSGKKLLTTGVSNYSDTWFVINEFDGDIDELAKGCWDDIECKGDIAGEHGGIKNLKKAFTILVSPIIEHIKESELLYIIPCEGLHNFPFHALHGLIDRKEQFLIEKYEITYLPSPLLLCRLSKDDIPVINGKDKGLAFGCMGDDIGWEERKKELSELGIVTEDSPSHGFKKLTESKYTRKVLYLIGHGYLPEKGQSPFNARLSLIDTGKPDVEISARQFAELGPKARFVFLNSCWLGYGAGYGRDAYGFPFSIIGSANSSCLVSATSVDIEFAHFFTKMVFKSIFQDSIDRSTAIAHAIRETIQSPSKTQWKTPYFWAPYFFYGDFRPL
ncbi:MAG: CHAT domain-containing protein [Nitrospinae bacterium]|nr:CHAT domain-containing protein [Nitrospinota bacterium]